MKKIVALFALALAVLAVAPAAQAQETPQPMVATYDALANAVLALRQAEFDFIVAEHMEDVDARPVPPRERSGGSSARRRRCRAAARARGCIGSPDRG